VTYLLNAEVQVEQGKGKQADHLRAIEHFLQAHSIASARYTSLFFNNLYPNHSFDAVSSHLDVGM